MAGCSPNVRRDGRPGPCRALDLQTPPGVSASQLGPWMAACVPVCARAEHVQNLGLRSMLSRHDSAFVAAPLQPVSVAFDGARRRTSEARSATTGHSRRQADRVLAVFRSSKWRPASPRVYLIGRSLMLSSLMCH